MNSSSRQLEMERVCEELILCPQQPGMLRISRQACALRFLLAQKSTLELPDDEFGMIRKVGLDICRSCPQGRFYAGKGGAVGEYRGEKGEWQNVRKAAKKSQTISTRTGKKKSTTQ